MSESKESVVFEFVLPDVGEGLQEATILDWYVESGDFVEADQRLLEVETDKAVVELPSPVSGVIRERPYESGETVDVGEVLVRIETDSESAGRSSGGTVVGSLPETEPSTRETQGKNEPHDGKQPSRVLAAPSTRKLARELGVDLSTVVGTGSGGRITREDVRKSAEKNSGPTEELQDHHQRIPLKGVRGAVARRMEVSHGTIPQSTLMDEVNMEPFFSNVSLDSGRSLPLTGLMLKLLSDLLDDYPRFNARYHPQEESFYLVEDHNIGVAVDTEEGVLAPVVESVDEAGWAGLQERLAGVVERARKGLREDGNLRTGITLSNVGPLGGRWAVPLLNPPQVSMLVLGEVRNQPWVHEGTVKPQRTLPLSLCFDHRLLDGGDAARFLQEVKVRLTERFEWLPQELG